MGNSGHQSLWSTLSNSPCTIHLFTAVQQVRVWEDRFIVAVDANAILSKLVETDIISDDYQTKVSQMTNQAEQNQFLWSHFMKTCETRDLMEVCDIISAVKGNRKMKRLGVDMKDMLEKGQYCTCWCVQVKLCMLAHASYTIITSFHDYSIYMYYVDRLLQVRCV